MLEACEKRGCSRELRREGCGAPEIENLVSNHGVGEVVTLKEDRKEVGSIFDSTFGLAISTVLDDLLNPLIESLSIISKCLLILGEVLLASDFPSKLIHWVEPLENHLFDECKVDFG